MEYNSNECIHICILCGNTKEKLDLKMSYEDENKKISQYRYNRLKHFEKIIQDYPSNLQDRLMNHFKQLQTAFNTINEVKTLRNKEGKNKNLFCFHYIVYKLLEIMEEDASPSDRPALLEYVKKIKLKKLTKNIHMLDSEFRKICFINNWKFKLTHI